MVLRFSSILSDASASKQASGTAYANCFSSTSADLDLRTKLVMNGSRMISVEDKMKTRHTQSVCRFSPLRFPSYPSALPTFLTWRKSGLRARTQMVGRRSNSGPSWIHSSFSSLVSSFSVQSRSRRLRSCSGNFEHHIDIKCFRVFYPVCQKM